MTDRHRKEAEAYSRQVTEVQAQLEPLKRRNNELQAHVDTHQEELKIVSMLMYIVAGQAVGCTHSAAQQECFFIEKATN